MADTLESLEIEISHSSTGVAKEIGSVTTAITNLRKSVERSLDKLNSFVSIMQQLGKISSPINITNNAYTGNTFNKNVQSATRAAKSATSNLPSAGLDKDLAEHIGNADKLQILIHKGAEAMDRFNEAVRAGDAEGAWKAREKHVNAYNQAVREMVRQRKEAMESEGAKEEPLGLPEHVAETVESATKPLDEFTQHLISTASQANILSMKLEDLRAKLQQAFESGDQEKAIQYRNQILQVEAQLNRIANEGKKAKSATEGTSKGIKDLGENAKKASGPLSNMISSLKRIAMYRVLRSIIKEIGQAFQEGLEKAYLFSAGMSGEGNRFAQSLDRMKSASNAMKGQLGAAFAGLLTAVEPILMTLIELVTKVADAMSQLFSAFTGKTYLKANATAAKFSDAMDKGAKGAKEWKNQLLGFDEINRLNEPSGGSGSGTNPMAGYSFEDAEISEKWRKIAENLRPILDDLGKMFGGLRDIVLGILEGDISLALQGLGTALESFGDLGVDVTASVNRAFDDLSDNGIRAIGDLIDKIGEWTGLDLRKLKERILYGLNYMRFYIEGVALQISWVFQDLCYAISRAVQGDWEGAWEYAKKAVQDASIDILPTVQDMAKQVTDEMMGTSETISTESGESTALLTLNSTIMSDDLAAVGNTSASLADTFAANMDAMRTQTAAMAGTGVTITPTYGGGFVFGSMVNWVQTASTRMGHSGHSGKFASGGFPDEGSLFFANEAGPELVGTMGGRTAVANQQEITEGIRQGVYDAVSAAMSNGNNNVTEFRLFLDSREVKYGLQKLDRAWG